MAWSIGRVSLAAAVAVGAFAIAPGGAGSQEGPEVPPPVAPTGCAAPYATVDAAEWASSPRPPLPFDSGTEVTLASTVVDTDGDGVEDTITHGTGGFVSITRGTGTLTFTGPVNLGSPVTPFDADGDGGSDLLVGSADGEFVVLGSTPSGTVPLPDVGIELPTGTGSWIFVGDTDDDGSDDLAAEVDDATTEVHSGAAIVAVGAGNAYDGAPIRTGPGSPVAGLRFAGGSVVATVEPVFPEHAIVHLLMDQELVLTTVGSGVPWVTFDRPPNDAFLVVDGSISWIALEQADRGGNRVWVWELTDLCLTRVDPPTTTPEAPEAPPAQAVDAEAQLTG